MKNANYSTVYFSIFSPNILQTPIKNVISPINKSVKKIINEKNKNNKNFYRKINNINIANSNTFNERQKKIYKIYKSSQKIILDSTDNNDISYKQKKIKSFYATKQIKKEPKFRNLKKFGKDFIIIRSASTKKPYKPLKKCKSQKYSEEPYKKYLYEKNIIEKNKKAKEIEINYIIESKKKQKLKIETDIRNKYQGLDFSKQKKRDCFMLDYLKSKHFGKKEDKNKNDDDNLYSKHLMKKLYFEMYEKKYLFLENNEMIPHIKYTTLKHHVVNYVYYHNLKYTLTY